MEALSLLAKAATPTEVAVQRVLSGRGAAGDVPAPAGRSLSDRAGDARRPIARTLRQWAHPRATVGPSVASAPAAFSG